VPLLDEAITLLGRQLPIMDVAQILGAELALVPGKRRDPAELQSRTKEYLDRSTPLFARAKGGGQHAFLLIPASEAGKALGEALHAAIPDLKVVRVAGQADLMFCREQACLTMQDLQRLLKPCRVTYDNLAANPTSSAHARFDITDWVPLDP
jgi:hypothetical protein